MAENADQPTGVQCIRLEDRLYKHLAAWVAVNLRTAGFDGFTLGFSPYFGVFCIAAFHECRRKPAVGEVRSTSAGDARSTGNRGSGRPRHRRLPLTARQRLSSVRQALFSGIYLGE